MVQYDYLHFLQAKEKKTSVNGSVWTSVPSGLEEEFFSNGAARFFFTLFSDHFNKPLSVCVACLER